MIKYFCLLCLIVLIACSAEPDSVDNQNKTANAHTQLMARPMTDEHALAKRKLFLQRDYDSSDAPTENRIVDVANFPKSPVHFSGHVLLVISDYRKNGRKYLREALGDSDITIDFSARSPRISGSAENFVLIESEYTGNFRSRNVALKSTKIVATATGALRASGRLGSYDQPFRYYGQLDILDNLGKIANTTVQSTVTDGFIFTIDDGNLAAYGLLKPYIISDTPAFSGTGLNAISLGLSAHHE